MNDNTAYTKIKSFPRNSNGGVMTEFAGACLGGLGMLGVVAVVTVASGLSAGGITGLALGIAMFTVNQGIRQFSGHHNGFWNSLLSSAGWAGIAAASGLGIAVSLG